MITIALQFAPCLGYRRSQETAPPADEPLERTLSPLPGHHDRGTFADIAPIRPGANFGQLQNTIVVPPELCCGFRDTTASTGSTVT